MSVRLLSLPAATRASVRSVATCGGVPMIGATATLVERLSRLVALLQKLEPLLGLPGPPPQALRQAARSMARTSDALRLKQPTMCHESAPNKTLPLLAAQHRSRQICRDGTLNPFPHNRLPAPARSRPVLACIGFPPKSSMVNRSQASTMAEI